MGLLFNVFTWVYSAVEGWGAAGCTRVAHHLGAAKARAARRAATASVGAGFAASAGW